MKRTIRFSESGRLFHIFRHITVKAYSTHIAIQHVATIISYCTEIVRRDRSWYYALPLLMAYTNIVYFLFLLNVSVPCCLYKIKTFFSRFTCFANKSQWYSFMAKCTPKGFFAQFSQIFFRSGVSRFLGKKFTYNINTLQETTSLHCPNHHSCYVACCVIQNMNASRFFS